MGAFGPILLIGSLLAGAAVAQPRREGDIYNFRDHQPTEKQVRGSESRAGVAPSPAQRRDNKDEVDKLDRQLLKEEGQPAPNLGK